jgi:hypothetical protein
MRARENERVAVKGVKTIRGQKKFNGKSIDGAGSLPYWQQIDHDLVIPHNAGSVEVSKSRL